MKPVGGLEDDLALRAVEHVRGHFFAAVSRQAVQEDRILGGERHQVLVDLERSEEFSPLVGLVFLPHARPDIGVDDVSSLDGLLRIVVDDQGNTGKPGREPCPKVGRKLVARGAASTKSRPRRADATASDRATLLPSPTKTSRRPQASRTAPRSSSGRPWPGRDARCRKGH